MSIITVFENLKKISFNNASEASYVYILSGQKLLKNSQNSQFDEFWYIVACGQTVLPDRFRIPIFSHCLKITQNVAFEFSNFGIFHHFLSYEK